MRCNFCMNAGLPNTFHPMRSAFGHVICPVLKETACSNCGEKGHTPKYCEQPLKKREHTPIPVVSFLPVPAVAPGLNQNASRLNPNAKEFCPAGPFSFLMNPCHSPTLSEYQARRQYLSADEKQAIKARIASDFENFVRNSPFAQTY